MIDRDMMRPAQVELKAAVAHLRAAAQAILGSEDHPSMPYADPEMRRRYEAVFDAAMELVTNASVLHTEMSCLMALGV